MNKNQIEIARIIATLVFTVIIMSCTPSSDIRNQSQANLELASRYFSEVYNEDKIDLIDTLFDKDYSHTNTSGQTWSGTDRLKTVVDRVKAMFPNLKMEVIESSSDGEKVMLLVNFQSDMPEFAKTELKSGKLNRNELFIFWIHKNKIYKGRTLGDHFTLIKQASGFKGDQEEAIKVLSGYQGSGKESF